MTSRAERLVCVAVVTDSYCGRWSKRRMLGTGVLEVIGIPTELPAFHSLPCKPKPALTNKVHEFKKKKWAKSRDGEGSAFSGSVRHDQDRSTRGPLRSGGRHVSASLLDRLHLKISKPFLVYLSREENN